MDFIIPLIVILLFAVMLMNNRGGSSQQRNQAQRPQTQRPQPQHRQVQRTQAAGTVKPDQPAPEPKQEEHDAFCQASGAEESMNWDSEGDFNEGYDPCHEDMFRTYEPVETETEAEMPSEEAKDILKGIVWSEILTRKRR